MRSDIEGFLLIVGDVDAGDPHLLLDRLELDLERAAQPCVECTERLVEQEHRRLQHKRAGERNALLLPPESWEGRRRWSPSSRTSWSALATFGPRSCLSTFRKAEAEGVLCDVQVGKEGVALEDGVHRALVADLRHVAVAEKHAAARRPSKPATSRSVVVFPQPDLSQQREELPSPIRASARGRHPRRRSSC